MKKILVLKAEINPIKFKKNLIVNQKIKNKGNS